MSLVSADQPRGPCHPGWRLHVLEERLDDVLRISLPVGSAAEMVVQAVESRCAFAATADSKSVHKADWNSTSFERGQGRIFMLLLEVFAWNTSAICVLGVLEMVQVLRYLVPRAEKGQGKTGRRVALVA